MTRTLPTQKIYKMIVGLLVVTFLVTACGANGGLDPQTQSTVVGTASVDPLFREFYDHLGGASVIGPAISPSFDYDNRRYQYFQAACMEYDPSAPSSERFHLCPLGLDMNIIEPAVPDSDASHDLYVSEHFIYQGFVEMYRKLGGARFVGRPLTEVHYNPDKKRYEQYFENLGFFWLEGDPPQAVHLLAYGSWKCAEQCPSQPPSANEIILPTVTPGRLSDEFTQIVSRLGSVLTGFALTPPYQAEDGLYEQVFESLVIAVDAQDPARIAMRPLPEKIGILAGEPIPPNNVEGMYFWPTDGELGHNVPQAFFDFILQHGGQEVSGNPTSELFLASDQVFRQCFANYCLDYHMGSNIPDALRIRPAPLGYTYKDLFYHEQGDNSFVQSQDLHQISLQVWEKHPFVTTKEAQRIGVSLFEGNQPLKDVEPVLTLTMPDGSQQSFYFPPTGSDGQTSKRLGPISAPNGTLIPYEVCISSITGERFCVKDSFVIWNNE